MKRILSVLIILLLYSQFLAQKNDSLTKKSLFLPKISFKPDSDMVFNQSRIAFEVDSLMHPELQIGGYVSTYYSTNDDDNLSNGFVQFPTLEPRKDQFSLNMALISLKYNSQNFRSNITLHYGDVPESSWPKTFNLIQEANGGFRIYKKLWFDAGFFKTHIGIESFQPRENITTSMSMVNFYEPYFLSGAKLTYYASSKLSLQVNVFNGYNEYLDNNKNKAFGFSAAYAVNQNLSINYNVLTCDETPDATPTKHQRLYNNLYATFQFNKFTLGAEANYGLQKNSLKTDSTKTATMYSGLIVAKYQILKVLAPFARLETFNDPNKILTGSLDIGKYIRGTTVGIEYKPQKTVSLNAEWRILQSDNLIFKQGNYTLNQRNEFNLCLDLWF
jgi:hypothetical protein